MGKLVLFVFVVSVSTTVCAHSGRTDRCGGHNDRKNGGYHVHNEAKYCSCYPKSKICKDKK